MSRSQGKRGRVPVTSAVYLGAGVQLAAATVGGLLLGHYLDGRFGTDPWLTALGVVLGFAGGIVNLVKMVRLIERR